MSNKLMFEDGIGFVELLDVFGDDVLVANGARVSFNKESCKEPILDQEGEIIAYKVSERDEKLINFLAEHKHVTPFFHPIIRLRLSMPLFVARQWFKHVVGFARNEVSRRYVAYEPKAFIPNVLRKADKNIKQGSSSEPIENNDAVVAGMHEHVAKAVEYYNHLLSIGVCPEQARIILPQSTYTEFIETGSLAAYARLVKLRDEATAQKEIQDYARRVSELIEPHFKVSWKALMQYQ
ncbi:FAD-dependent thymidylate synthase [Candidatus Babeliales bacterium]|nr:FAD-dependent thymidylate synthase [Candidatus Babeliales bacterium]